MKKRILFAIPTLGGGGAEKVLITLLNNLDRNKYDITLFTIFDEGVNKKYLKTTIKYKTFYSKVFKGNIHFLKLFSPEKLYNKMIKEEYDIAISFLEGPMTRIIGGCPFPNTRLINWIHTEIHKPWVFSKSYRSLNEAIKIHKNYNETVFVSNTALCAFDKTFKDIQGKFLVKYNVLDNELILSKASERITDVTFNHEKINLISVGRFTKVKGYTRLIEIIKLLKDQNIIIHLYLIGSGKLHNKYLEMIKQLKLESDITILGFKDNPYKYIKKCDLYVCSSYQEGFNTAVAESIIIGTPVVTTLCSGMEEMIGSNNEYGIITENDLNSLYLGISRVLTEEGLLDYYKRQVNKRSSSFNTIDNISSIEQLLDEERF